MACLPQEEENAMPTEDSICYSVGWGESYRSSSSHKQRHRRPTFFNPFYWAFGGRFWNAAPISRRRPEALREVRVNVDPPEKCFHHDDENDVQICAGSSEMVSEPLTSYLIFPYFIMNSKNARRK